MEEIDLLLAREEDASTPKAGPAAPLEVSVRGSEEGSSGFEGTTANVMAVPDFPRVEVLSLATTARSNSKRKRAVSPTEDERPPKTGRYSCENGDSWTRPEEVEGAAEHEAIGAWLDPTLYDCQLLGTSIVSSVGPMTTANLGARDCTDWESLGGTMWDDLREIELRCREKSIGRAF